MPYEQHPYDSTFITSDPHFDHPNILKHCGRTTFMTERDREEYFAAKADATGERMRRFRPSQESVEIMNRGLINNINARVGRHDVLWCLGDWGMRPKRRPDFNRYFRRCREIRDQIQCQNINMVWGNHDHDGIADLFSHTYDLTQTRIGQASVTLCHYPLVSWNGQHHGSPENPNVLLYGHVHDKDATRRQLVRPETWAALDVGVDSHDFQAWSLRECLDHLTPYLQRLSDFKRSGTMFDVYRDREKV